MTNDEQRITRLVARHKRSGVVIDTNLLIVLLIGIFDPRHLSGFRRTKSYVVDDFRVLFQFVHQFDRLIVTPHILTEVSNLVVMALPGKRVYNFFKVLDAQLAIQPGQLIVDEQHRPARFLTAESEFYRLGLTDAGIIHRAKHKHYLVLTDDGPLGDRLRFHRIDLVTLDDLRSTASP